MKHVASIVAIVFVSVALAQQSSPFAAQVAKIRAVGREGQGHDEAKAAVKALVQAGPAALPDILNGFDGASPLAANWLRSAFESVIDKAASDGGKIDLAILAGYLADTKHSGPARRLAFETLVRFDPSASDKLTPTFLDDPGNELRRDAVSRLLKDAQKALDAKNTDGALSLYKKSLHHARDKDQVTLAAERLKKLGVETDLTRHFGFITTWSLAGPFDNVKGVGFKAVYPPEKGVDRNAGLIGKNGEKVVWKTHVTEEPLGLVDLNKVIGKLKGAVYFGHAVVESPAERPIEVRAGSNNAVCIYLNGKEIYSREEYHHGMQMDQHVGRGVLKAGRNEILIKCLQNEQTEPWAQQWSFQVRLCDHLGGATPFVQKAE